jgi:hypothetical protein
MFLILIDLIMVAHRWAEIPHARQCTPRIIARWIEDVALVDSWMPSKDEIVMSLSE